MKLLDVLRNPLFILLAVFFIGTTAAAIAISLYSPFDYVATSKYIVIDNGHMLIIMTKFGMCVPLSEVYLPPGLVHHIQVIEHELHVNARVTNLESLINDAPILGMNITASARAGKINSTYVCGLVVVKYG